MVFTFFWLASNVLFRWGQFDQNKKQQGGQHDAYGHPYLCERPRIRGARDTLLSAYSRVKESEC
jgi:hypothetical protein